jgi:hypothetical protein
MRHYRRSNLAVGLILILIGVWFLAVQVFPNLRVWFNLSFSWPLIVIGAGVLLLLIGLLAGEAGMAVPACIVGGIGGLLYYQNLTGNWDSWAYAWTLIPGFVGAGVILSGLLGNRPKRSLGNGLNLIVISLVLFLIFAAFLGGPNLFGPFWPLLIILLGLWLIVRPLFNR